MGSGHNRELTLERKLHPATVASMRLQNEILGRQSAEFNVNGCQQGLALIDDNLCAERSSSNEKRSSHHHLPSGRPSESNSALGSEVDFVETGKVILSKNKSRKNSNGPTAGV